MSVQWQRLPGRRVTCNTCGQAKCTTEAGPTLASVGSATGSKAAECKSARHSVAEAAPVMPGSSTCPSIDTEPAQPAPPSVILQPGFVDFAALSRRIFSTEAGAAEAEPPAEPPARSRTYEVAAAVMPEATVQHSAVQTAVGEAQTSPAASTPQQHLQCRTYEAAGLHSAGVLDQVTSTARRQDAASGYCRDVRTHSREVLAAPDKTAQSIISGAPSGVNSSAVLHKHQRGSKPQQRAAQPGAPPARSGAPAAAAPQPPAASEEDHSTTNSDTDGSRRRRSSRQRTMASPVSQPRPYVVVAHMLLVQLSMLCSNAKRLRCFCSGFVTVFMCASECGKMCWSCASSCSKVMCRDGRPRSGCPRRRWPPSAARACWRRTRCARWPSRTARRATIAGPPRRRRRCTVRTFANSSFNGHWELAV